MKFKSLQFEKAISAALFVLLLVVVGSKNALAQNQVATLQHGDDMTAFYGLNALVEAHAAATDGDVITLSSGTFNGVHITKAITLHGAGCVSDTLGITPTLISGSFGINVSNDSQYIVIEGISSVGDFVYFNNLYRAKFIKCSFNSFNAFNTTGATMVYDVQLINCRINSRLGIVSNNNSVSLINCIVMNLTHLAGPFDYVNIYNSIIFFQGSQSKLNLHNSVISAPNNVQITDSYAYNCIEIGSTLSNSVYTYDCMSVDSYSDVFESFNGTFSFDADFHLKEEIATTFLGSDGSQVGIYGGMRPYKTRPGYLILNRCNVASQSTIDNKLSVDIEVISNGE